MTARTPPRHTNRLADETSPYLLQHAHNPVDWYPWGPDALERARVEDRPIFLSIGYAACHWCHVMERESFEDEATAAFLNDHFVSIKVDREERPDLDAIYMDAVQAMTGGGGWPMSVFLLPDGRPFYGGTYFPNRHVHGMPTFREVLEGVLAAYRNERDQVEAAAAQLTAVIDGAARRTPDASTAASAPAQAGLVGPDGRPIGARVVAPPALERSALDAAVLGLEHAFDARNGGWGGAPKFPAPMTIELLLRLHATGGDGRALAMARRTLDAMAAGGIYDHLGGGFARYATDAVWLVPHFEKMLYDNAQLARAYTHAWLATGDDRYAEVARETLDFLLREMRLPDGTFASSLDADTEGEEGATYVWRAEEVDAVLGDDAPLFAAAYGVTPGGNWEGVSVLSRVLDDPELAARFALPVDAVAPRLADARRRLLAVRDQRPQPGRDDKALAAWNGLAVGAFADAAVAFDSAEYRDAAVAAAEALLRGVRIAEGRLRRSWKDGRALHDGVLEDYADLADGLLALYEATWDERWFALARELVDSILARFRDGDGGFYDTPDDGERLVARPKGIQDGAVPSGGAMVATVLVRLAALTGDARYREAAEAALREVLPAARRYPTAFSQWLVALDLATARIDEVAIVGTPGDEATDALVAVALRGLRPHRVVAVGAGTPDAVVPLLRDRPRVDGRPAAYVCHGFACLRPVTSPDDLAAQLRDGA